MYYALLDMRNDCCASTGLIWGETLRDVANALIATCDAAMKDTDDMPMEELEEVYYCEFLDYGVLVDCENPTIEMLNDFSFTLSDATIDVGCLVEGYAALVRAFSEYAEDKTALDEWDLVPAIEETEENLTELDDELRRLNTDDLRSDEYRFFLRKVEKG